jgi:hypothetical protein
MICPTTPLILITGKRYALSHPIDKSSYECASAGFGCLSQTQHPRQTGHQSPGSVVGVCKHSVVRQVTPGIPSIRHAVGERQIVGVLVGAGVYAIRAGPL